MIIGRYARARLSSTSASTGSVSRTRLRCFPPSPSAPRESPTGIVLCHGLWHSSDPTWSLAQVPLLDRLSAMGHVVGVMDLPGYGLAQSFPSKWSLDDLVNDMRQSLSAFPAPPVVIAPSFSSHLFQKYLESHALAGLVMVSPFPLDAHLFIRHLLVKVERREGKGATNAVKPLRHGEASVQRISAALRSVAFDETNAQSLFCSGGTDSPPPWLERWVETAQASISLESGSGVDEVESDSVNSGMHLCGVEAGAQILHLLAREPVLVEPFPVQMMALTSSRSEKKRATAQGVPMDGASTADAAASDDTLATCKYLTDATLGDACLARHGFLQEGGDALLWEEKDATCGEELLFDQSAIASSSAKVLEWVEERY